MRKTIILYGLSLALLIFLMKFLEYRFFVHDLSVEIYLAIIALLCAGIGVWAGLRLTRPKKIFVPVSSIDFKLNEALLEQTGISRREYDVLELMAKGLSNQEIADKLFVSLNTVKTHSSNLFVKLDAKRRTQAIQKAKDLGLIA
jgi:two-component system, NarL family, response regulator LiaR